MTESSTLSGRDGRFTPSSLPRRLRDGDDPDAWAQLAAGYRQFILRLVRRRGLSHHDADEVAQEVLVSLSKNIHQFEPQPRPGGFRKWLSQLAHWRVYDHHRRRPKITTHSLQDEAQAGLEEEVVETLPPLVPDPVAVFEAESRLRIVRMALRRLRPRFSLATLQIYELHVVDGWDVMKVCRFLGIKRANVYMAKSRVTPFLRREVQRLQAQMATRIQDPEGANDATPACEAGSETTPSPG